MKRMKRLLAALLAMLMLAAAAPVTAAPASETNGDYKLLALTFDDGPCKNTPRLLDGLAKLGAKATFFMVGQWIEQYPDIPARMVAEGHEIANHSYSHPTLNWGNVSYQLEKNRQLLAQYDGDRTYCVRAPYGSFTAESAFNGPSIWVALDVSDYKRTDAAGMARDVIRIVKDGDIFLFHDTHSTSVDAALIVVEELQKQGYEFVTVSELFRRRGVVPENGKRYTSVPNTGINLGPLEEEEDDPEYFDESKLSEHWGYEGIEYVLEHGLFYGTDEGFSPNRKMTRAMFLTVLGRIAGVGSAPPASAPFSDVPAEHWAAPYIAWAAENGIIDKDSGAFDLDGYITREDMAMVIYRYMKYADLADTAEETGETNEAEEPEAPEESGKSEESERPEEAEVPEEPERPDLPYADADEISSFAIGGVKYCTDNALLMGDGFAFHPKDNTTRAEAAILFMRLQKLILALEQPAPGEDDAEPSGEPDAEEPAPEGPAAGE